MIFINNMECKAMVEKLKKKSRMANISNILCLILAYEIVTFCMAYSNIYIFNAVMQQFQHFMQYNV